MAGASGSCRYHGMAEISNTATGPTESVEDRTGGQLLQRLSNDGEVQPLVGRHALPGVTEIRHVASGAALRGTRSEL